MTGRRGGLSTGYYAVFSRGKFVAKYRENRLARMRAAFVADAQILWISDHK
jgi:hypothetical protein